MEHQPSSERARRPEMTMRQFRNSHALSNRLYANAFSEDAPSQLASTNSLPDTLIDAVSNGSHRDRVHYWKKSSVTNWGEQMATWIEGGEVNGQQTEGMAEWIEAQYQKGDTDVEHIFQRMGLSPSQTGQADIQPLLDKINSYLEIDGNGAIDPEELSQSQVGALLFYSRYLDAKSSSQRTEMTKQLLEDAVSGAAYDIADDISSASEEERSAMAEKIFTRLDMITPLLQVTGEEAQHAVAALLAAKVHGIYESEKVVAARKPMTDLDSHEQHALTIIKRYHNSLTNNQDTAENSSGEGDPQTSTEKREVTPSADLIERFQKLPGSIDTERQFYIESPSFVNLTDGQARNLEARRPFFVPIEGQQGMVNPTVEDKPSLPRLATIERFSKGEELFAQPNEQGAPSAFMSGIAAVSAETPEKQAAYYLALGDMVLQVHKNNPDLLNEHLAIQSRDYVSNFIYVNHELKRRSLFIDEKKLGGEINKLFTKAREEIINLQEFASIRSLLGELDAANQAKDRDRYVAVSERLSQDAIYQEYERRLTTRMDQLMQDSEIGKLLAAQNSEGLLALQLSTTSIMTLNQPITIDIQATAEKVRSQRAELEKAIREGTLTREQSEVLTLLSDAVRLEDAANLLKEKLENTTPVPSNPDNPGMPPAPHSDGESMHIAPPSAAPEEPAESPDIFSLESGRQYRVDEVYQHIESQPTQAGNAYWVEQVPSADKVLALASEKGWHSLEVTKPVYENVTVGFEEKAHINPEVFRADSQLHDNNRYQEANRLLEGEGLLLGLAGASAETPERQAQLYRALSRVVLEVHSNNPQLFQKFLEAQANSQSETFIAYRERQDNSSLRDQLQEFFDAKTPLTQEGVTKIAQASVAALDIAGKDDRLVALRLEAPNVEAGKSIEPSIDIEATIKGWDGRVDKLRELLSQPEVVLTSEQMKQIEFLAHAVDVTQVVERINGQHIDRTAGRRTTPKSHNDTGDAMEAVSALDGKDLEQMGPPPGIDTQQLALEEFPKMDRDGVKEGTESAAIKYQEQRFYYLRALLLDWGNQERVGALQDAIGAFPLSDVGIFLRDTEKITANPDVMLELDSVFQGNMSMYSFGKGKHAMRNIFGDLTRLQSEAVHTLLQQYANQQMNEEFPLALRLLGLHISGEDWKKDSLHTTSKLTDDMQDKLLSLELRVEETTKQFFPEEKEFLKKLLRNMPTRADQLMAILYYYTLWHERQGGNKQLGRKHLISDLRRTADRTQERLGGKDELEYFASFQNT